MPHTEGDALFVAHIARAGQRWQVLVLDVRKEVGDGSDDARSGSVAPPVPTL